jgi:hypothetical protein
MSQLSCDETFQQELPAWRWIGIVSRDARHQKACAIISMRRLRFCTNLFLSCSVRI